MKIKKIVFTHNLVIYILYYFLDPFRENLRRTPSNWEQNISWQGQFSLWSVMLTNWDALDVTIIFKATM